MVDGATSREEWRLYDMGGRETDACVDVVIDVSVWVSNCRVGVGVGSSGHV